MIILLKRLQAVADMIIEQQKLADIGADHALLSLYLLENQLVPGVIIGELGDGPYQRSLQAVQSSPMQDLISVRQGDGLEVLDRGEVQTVVLAGMGGDTICGILGRDDEKARSFGRYVFQPMSKAGVLRRYLSTQGWPIIREQLIWENNKYFLVIASEPGDTPYQMSELELELGQEMLRADSEMKRKFLHIYLEKYRKVYDALIGADKPGMQLMVHDYQQRIKELEMILGASSS